jgi:photosystem II stability/assembly factor-like uncharacterized protein
MKYLTIILLFSLVSLCYAAEFKKMEVPTEADINEIYFDNAAYGWAATSEGELLSTYDGGKSWRKKEITSRSINDIEFKDRLGYLCGDRGLLMKSTDRGATWQDISMGMKFRFTSVAIVNDSAAVVCGTDQNSMAKTRGVLFHSWDYGRNWLKAPRYGNGYSDLAVTRPEKIYVLAIKKVSHSINSGVSYFHGRYGGDRLAFDFDFIEDFGFMVGSKGLLARSMDHGRTWKEIELDITKDLFAVKIFNETSGVAVGQDGIVVFFEEGGQRTSSAHCGYDIDLDTVFAVGNKIFVGGKEGILLAAER